MIVSAKNYVFQKKIVNLVKYEWRKSTDLRLTESVGVYTQTKFLADLFTELSVEEDETC